MTILNSWINSCRQRRALRRQRHNALRLFAKPFLLPLEDRTVPSAFTVTTLDDSGPGSLRQAILDADAHVNGAADPTDTISFAVAGTIAIATPLPELSDPTGGTIIDGRTAPGYAGAPAVVLHGPGAASGVSGLSITSANNQVWALQIDSFQNGVVLSGSGAAGNWLAGNYIGTDGTTALGNATGVWLAGASNNRVGTDGDAAERNVISGNQGGPEDGGVRLSGFASGNVVAGNYIGTDAAGAVAIGNRTGIFVETFGPGGNVYGGTAPVLRNVISGNGTGVSLFGSAGDVVQGNYIGTDATGIYSVGNTTGVSLAFGAFDNLVGGTAPGAGNVISGNVTGVGFVHFGTQHNTVQGNFIGPDATGNRALGNASRGIDFNLSSNNTIGGTDPGAGNVIAGNGATGVFIADGSGNQVLGNLIGVGADGTRPLGNGQEGVHILFSLNNTIAGNTIAYNARNGVLVSTIGGFPSDGNLLRGNAVFANTLLGIDLGGDGVTPNDPSDTDAGPNDLQNYPVLTQAVSTAAGTAIAGTFNSAPGTTFTLEFFASPAVDPSGLGEGTTPLGLLTVTTDAGGNADFTAQFAAVVPAGFVVTATATDPANNTSEFSVARVVVAGNHPPVAVPDTYDVNEEGTLTVGAPGVLANDSDPDSDRLTATVASAPLHGSLALSADGSFTYTPADGFSGTDSFFYVVSDGQGGTAQGVATITVNWVNHAPVVGAGDLTVDPAVIPEGSPVGLSGTFRDTDTWQAHTVVIDWGDGAHDTLSLTAGATGFGPVRHAYRDDSAQQPGGRYPITVTVTDELGASSSAATGVVVTNAPPVAQLGPDRTVSEGTPVNLTGNFTDPGVLDAHTFLWHVTSSNGQSVADGTDPSFSFTPLDDGTYTVTLTVTDNGGGVGQARMTVTATNVAPSAQAGPDQTVNEGTPVTLTGSFTDAGRLDTQTYRWHVTSSNGQFVADGTNANFSFSPVDNGTYTVTFTVTDKDGGVGTDTAVITVNNVAPTVSAGGNQTVNEGSSVTLAGSVSDPGAIDTFTYNWHVVSSNGQTVGDGTAPNFTFTPADNGTYAVTVTVTDKDGGVGTSTVVVTVNNVVPTANAGGNRTVNEGSAVMLTGTATDPGALDTPTYNWHVTSTNGQVVSDGSGQTFSFTPADNGTYTVTFTVTDKDGGVGTDTATVTVNNVAPTVNAGPDGTAVESTPTLGGPNPNDFVGGGSFSDPGADTWTAAVDYGDGSGAQALALGADMTFNLRHTYQQPGVFTVTVTVHDQDGGAGTGTLRVTVRNLAPVLAGQTNQSAVRGATTSFNLGGFGDVAADGPWAVDVNWGDGSAHTTWSQAAGGSLGAQAHAYAASGTYTVTVSVTDRLGAAGTASFQVAVVAANHAPVVVLNAPAAAVPGQDAVFSGSFTDPDAGDAWTATIDFGDGAGAQPLALNPDHTFSVMHTYLAYATDQVVVTVQDNGGASGSATGAVSVQRFALESDPLNPGMTAFMVGGTGANDTVSIGSGTAAGSLTLTMNGTNYGTFAPAAGASFSRVVVYGLAGNDTITVSSSVFAPAWLYGGDGSDWLGGGGGNDVLLGGAGGDVLTGNDGRDLLIGGDGADTLAGWGDNKFDIMIGGTTAFDANAAALSAIMAEWTSGRDYATRVNNLTNGSGSPDRLNGNYFLQTGQTVFHDAYTDSLIYSGQDWLFYDPSRDRLYSV